MTLHVEHIANKNKCREIKRKVENYFLISIKGREKETLLPKRVYCCACRKLGYSFPEIGDGIGMNQTTIQHHMRHITLEEIKKTEEFLSHIKAPQIREIPQTKKKLNIYEKTGFRYDGGKPECSTTWKRFYPLKPVYRGI